MNSKEWRNTEKDDRKRKAEGRRARKVKRRRNTEKDDRKRKDSINKIRNDRGDTVSDTTEIQRIIRDYHK